jgi:hypothetical protein
MPERTPADPVPAPPVLAAAASAGMTAVVADEKDSDPGAALGTPSPTHPSRTSPAGRPNPRNTPPGNASVQSIAPANIAAAIGVQYFRQVVIT